jgi:predicted CopG family antitoxin
MSIVTIELESDAVEKLKSARLGPQETFSDVVRRAEFPVKPSLARDLLEDFRQGAGSSLLTEEALDRLSETQANPSRSPSHWLER